NAISADLYPTNRHFWNVVVLLCCFATHSGGQKNTDFYTTVSTLSDLVHVEKQVKADLLGYVERLKVLRDNILSFVQDRQPYDDLRSPSAVSEYLKHPVHAFHLIKRMTAGLGAIEAQINKTREFDPLVNIEEWRKQRLLPWDEDFTGLAMSLVTLQDTYALDLHKLTEGHLHTNIPRHRTIHGRLPLNARDCLNISQAALEWGLYDRAMDWAERAIAKAADEEPPTIPNQELETHHEAIVNKVEPLVDLRMTCKPGRQNTLQTNGEPVRDPTRQSAESKAQLFQELPADQEELNYRRLCRGEVLRTPQMDSKLRCRYYKGQDGFFTLHPIKLEEINLKPYIIVMRDVVQERDIEDLMAFAEPRLQRSTTYTGDGNAPSTRRTSSNAWLWDDEAPIANRMNWYLRALVGLGTLGSEYEAEAYQLANYGSGGYFLPHYDYLQDTLHAHNSTADYYLQNNEGDRLATLMIYMTDVEEGGATVFPRLGVRLVPKKFDWLWTVFVNSPRIERAKEHESCLGDHTVCIQLRFLSHAVANKWFKSYSNVFRLPCSIDRNLSLAPLA
ncbi:prolyl 4-hydroxylase alpha subunit, putative, partial [Ixodes scapularis]